MQIPLAELENKVFRFLFTDSTNERKLSLRSHYVRE
jgi:hypothetical protein